MLVRAGAGLKKRSWYTRAGHRLKAILLYAVVSILIAFALIGMASVVIDEWGHDAYIRWGGLTGFTVALFTLFAGHSEKFLRKPRFWAVTAAILVAHLTAFAILLTHVEEWKLSWFMVMVFEYPFFFFIRDNFANLR